MNPSVQTGGPATARTTASAVTPVSNDTTIGVVTASSTPLHTNTQSNLTPTSEFTRLLLLAIPSRYIPRALAKFFLRNEGMQQMAYSLTMGIGSTLLSLKYGAMVKHDIKNIYSEAVAMEKGVPPERITFNDIKNSDNKIVQDTIRTYRTRMFKRLGTDALFFAAAPLTRYDKGILAHSDAKEALTDGLVGLKGAMALGETWNRKTTMFEDLVTFVTNKLNPRNGLGQLVTVGELFDLYQHYTEVHAPGKMFRHVLTRDTSESQLQAINKPVFTRMTELMNLSYAYKHGEAGLERIRTADFPLPKFIYLLGHDLIDPMQPERTMALVEVMNARGSEGVQQALAQLNAGHTPAEVLEGFGIPVLQAKGAPAASTERNTVIAKGSTMQPDPTPRTTVDTAGMRTAQLGEEVAGLSQ